MEISKLAPFQNINFLYNLIRYKIYGQRFPAHVAISVTNRCNLRCPYCFASYSAKEKDKLTTDNLLSLVDELCDKGTKLINITGGEPLLRKDIKVLIDYIVLEKGLRCSLSTNGLLLEEKIEVLKNITSINVSLDGNKEQHNLNRGLQSYEKIVKGIELAVNRKIPVSTCTVLNKTNMNCVEYIVKFSKNMGVHCIFHIPYGRLNDEENHQLKQMNFDETREVLQKIINYKKLGYPVYYSNKTHSYIRDWPYKQPSRILKKSDGQNNKGFRAIPCLAGDLYCFIDACGEVYPCTVLSGQVKVLNFLEVGFQAAWDYLPQIRCQACSFFFQNELNLLLSLNPSVCLNFIRTSKK